MPGIEDSTTTSTGRTRGAYLPSRVSLMLLLPSLVPAPSNPTANEREASITSIIGKIAGQLLALTLYLAVGCQGDPQQQIPDWPPLTMYYQVTATMNDGEEGILEYKLTYRSRDHWREDIVDAPPLVSPAGAFVLQGTYEVVRDGLRNQYDPNSDNVYMEVLEGDTEPLPGMGELRPMPLERLQRVYGREPMAVDTGTRVCFRGDCQDDARGWSFDLKRQHAYADDLRGIPIRLDRLDITEVLVNDVQQPFRGR